MERKSWEEFRESGLLWWINMILHTFGWSIVIKVDNEADEIAEVYPARVKFRGFDEECNSEGYVKITKYMRKEVETLVEEISD